MKAYQVLSDCKKAYELLEYETDPQLFRIYFAAAVTLCRAIGHVLDKVDSKKSPELAKRIAAWWNDLKLDDNNIFHDFIEKQRNLILKEYEFTHDDSIQTIIIPFGESFVLNELLFCPFTDGKYAGEDCRDILAEAINWWEMQLEKIEKS